MKNDKKKAKLTVTLEPELIATVREAVYGEQKERPEFTLTQFIRDAIANELNRIGAKKQSRTSAKAADSPAGEPRQIRRGRPMKKP